MKTETETRTGQCPTHGRVEGTRQIPRVQFPFVVYWLLRYNAKRKPFHCPTCDSPLDTG
jgi:hypothetical protein